MLPFFTRSSRSVRCRQELRALRSSAHFRIAVCAGALTLCLVGSISSALAADITGWVENWSLPQFSKEGYRTITARGTRARANTAQSQIEVVDLNLTFFSGDAGARVETILLSPEAIFLPNQNIARGEKSVRYIGEKIEASGTRWVYRHDEEKISLDGDVRVTFSAELKNLLQ